MSKLTGNSCAEQSLINVVNNSQSPNDKQKAGQYEDILEPYVPSDDEDEFVKPKCELEPYVPSDDEDEFVKSKCELEPYVPSDDEDEFVKPKCELEPYVELNNIDLAKLNLPSIKMASDVIFERSVEYARIIKLIYSNNSTEKEENKLKIAYLTMQKQIEAIEETLIFSFPLIESLHNAKSYFAMCSDLSSIKRNFDLYCQCFKMLINYLKSVYDEACTCYQYYINVLTY